MTANYLKSLFPAPQCDALFSMENLVQSMIEFELAYFQTQGGEVENYQGFQPNIAYLEAEFAKDGVIIPALVKDMREFHDDPRLHKGLTSQDVMDTAMMMNIKKFNAYGLLLLSALIDELATLEQRFGERIIMARTRMQAAYPQKAYFRLQNWKNGLMEAQADWQNLRPKLEKIALFGAVGDQREWENPSKIMQELSVILGLAPSDYSWHSLRGRIWDYASILGKISGHLAKIAQDIVLMAQQGVDDIALKSGGSSSAMPHKSNPVQAELLVSLGRYNAANLGALGQSLIHEQERSGAAWGLEWLSLPEIMRSTEAGLLLAKAVLQNIESIGKPIS